MLGGLLIEALDPSDSALDLLTTEQKADAIETMENTITLLRKVVDRLRHREASAPIRLTH
jgi:hypothetical protein